MPFENEFASYAPLRRILDSEKVQALNNRLRVRNKENSDADNYNFEDDLIHINQLPKSEFLPDYVIAIDGSNQPAKIENGYPGAELGYITISAVLIIEREIRNLAKQDFIDPQKFRETERSAAIDTVIPGCNVVIDNDSTAKASMRKSLYEALKNEKAFEEGETLLETYEFLFKIKRDLDERYGERRPQSPIEGVDKEMSYDYGVYQCPHSGQELYSTDALRLHELMNPGGSNGEMYGQIMQMLEKLWLIHILRAFEKKDWLNILDRVIFVVDGPLACFSTWSWLNKSIIHELNRINELQKKKTGKDLLIFGIEKSGTFYNHFEELDTKVDGATDRFPNQSALLLNDNYIKQNIIFSESSKLYGQDTYFGRKLFYKTKTGYRVVPVVAFFNKEQHDITTAEPNQFPRLGDLMNVLDELVSSRYPNSISPLVTAHSEAAIPLNLGKRIFEEISREIKKR
jgi:hypothetical protein